MKVERQISILVASAKVMSCELYDQALRQHPGFRVIGCASRIDGVIQAFEAGDVDVMLITTTLQDGPLSGLAALHNISKAYPATRSVVLLESSESHLVISAFRNGAKGVFCPAEDGIARLCRCVQQINAGQVWASSEQLQQLLSLVSRSAPVRVLNARGVRLLTCREEDVARLVQEGLTNRQIAQELNLSEHTVRNNLFRVYEKLGVSTRVELALYVMNNAAPAPCEEIKKDVTDSKLPARAGFVQ